METPHPVNADGWDHEPEPIARDGRVVESCDFCNQPGGSVVFRTRKVVVYKVGPFVHHLGNDWSACERCAGFIRSSSPHLLIDRATFLTRDPDTGEYLNRTERRAIRRQFKDIHMAFFKAQPVEDGKGTRRKI